MKKNLFLLLLCMTTLVACHKEPEPVDPNTPVVPDRPTPVVNITINNLETETFTCTFAKADSCENYYIYAAEPGTTEGFLAMFGFQSVEDAVKAWGINCTADTTYTWRGMTPNSDYVVYVLAHCEHADVLITDTIHTAVLGGHGESVIDLSVSNIGRDHVTTTAVPNDQTAMFKDLIITKNYFETIGRDSTINLLKEDVYVHYNTDTWTWSNLDPATDYYLVGIGQNADGQWGQMAILPFCTSSKH